MESNDDRQKKLEAGKEKLAAFRKRKEKKKKPHAQRCLDGTGANSGENDSDHLQNLENGLHGLCLTDPKEVWSDSEYSCTSEDECAEESETKSSVLLGAKLAQAKQRIAELEEAMEGKQLALDVVVRKSKSAKLNKCDAELTEIENSSTDRDPEVTEFESALAQRDALLSQLSATLFESLGNSELNTTVQTQVEALAKHVYQLQAQLRQADQTLEEQMHLHDSSTKALHDAKFQMLQLQEIITHKEQQMAKLTLEKNKPQQQELLQNTEDDLLQKKTNHNQIIAEHASKIAVLQEELSSKEAVWASREGEWTAREKDWMSREQEWAVRDEERALREGLLQSSIESQSAQIMVLTNAQDTLKAEEQELHATCARLKAELENSQTDAVKGISNLEYELKELKQAHESDQIRLENLNQLKQDLEEKVSSQSFQLSEYEALQVEHDTLSTKYTECLSYIRDLELAKCNLEEKIRLLDHSPAAVDMKAELDQLKLNYQDETEKQVEREKHYVELENKYSVDTDALNNKINELQSLLQKSEAAIQDATKAIDAEKFAVSELENTLQEKNEVLGKNNLKLTQMEECLRTLQAEKTEMQLTLSCKEEIVSKLKEQYKASQDALIQKEKESCNYAEQIVVLQDEAIAAKHIHAVEQSEWNYHTDQLDEQMETINSEFETMQAKLRDTEHQLTNEQDNKKEILESMQKLLGDFDAVKEEKCHILQTIQSLNTKLESFPDEWKSVPVPSQGIEDCELNSEVQNRVSEKSQIECDTLISKVDSLRKELEQYKLKLEVSESVVKDLNEKLADSENNLSSVQVELEKIHKVQASSSREAEIKLANLEMRASEAKQLQTEIASLKGLEQQLVERDRCQEELQSQLENTVSQWQRLQRIVQEKEIDLQQSQEALEEQQRICLTLRKTFDEEKEQLEYEVNQLREALQHEKEQQNISNCDVWDLRGKVQILEGELEILNESNCSHLAVLSDTVGNLQRELFFANDRSKLREAEILEAQQSIEDKVENLTMCITEKNVEIEELKNVAQIKEEELEGLKNELFDVKNESTEYKDRVNDLEKSVSTLESSLSQQKCILERKDQEIEDLTSRNQSQKEEIEIVAGELNGLKKVCDEISNSANLKVSGAEGLQAVFSKKDNDFSSLQDLVAQLEADLVTERSNGKKATEAFQSKWDETNEILESTIREKMTIESELLLMKEHVRDVENSNELLQAASSEMQIKLGESQEALHSVVKEKASINAELGQIKHHICESENKHDLLQSAHSELQTKLKETELTLQSTTARKCEIETELTKVKDEISAAEVKNTTVQTVFSEIQGKLDVIEQTLQTTNKDKEGLELELNEMKQRHSDLESNHNILSAAHSELQEQLENKEERLQVAANEKSHVDSELLQVTTQLSEAEENYKTLQIALTEGQEKFKRAEEAWQAACRDKETTEERLLEANQRLSEVQKECQHLQTSSQETQASVEENSNTIETLHQALKEKDDFICGLEKEKESLNCHILEINASLQRSQSLEASLRDAEDNLRLSHERKDILIGELESKLTNSARIATCLEGLASSLSQELQRRDETLVDQALKINEIVEEIQEKNTSLAEEKEKCSTLQQQNELFALQADLFVKENTEKQANMKVELEEMKQLSAVKEEQFLSLESLFHEEKTTHEETLKKLRRLEMGSFRMHCELSYLMGCEQEREAYLIDQARLTDEKSSELANVIFKLNERDAALSEAEEKHISSKEELTTAMLQLESLQSDKESLKAEISCLKVDLDDQETINTQYAVECKQLNERLTQMSQVLEAKEAAVFDLNHDIDMYQKEISDLRTETVQRDTNLGALQEELYSAKMTIERNHEEAEMLKSNFDSCIEDMQVKLTEQEAKTKRLQSQLAEETRNVHQGKDDLKEMFEQQISQMEDKVIKLEQQNDQLTKDLEDECNRATSSKDVYENHVAELELNLQASNSDLNRVKDELLKVTSNHDCAVSGLKRLHEIQTSELEDNCMALEKTVAEQKRHMNDMQSKFHKDKISLEQTFEIQISDMEEKRRITEIEVDRLKRHLEEMKSDHVQEMQELEKNYESRLFELEDKYCVVASERDRLRASLADQPGLDDSNTMALESKLHKEETMRRESELRNVALEDEVMSLKEGAKRREEEMISVLRDAADRHKEDISSLNNEVSSLNEQLIGHSKQAQMMKSDYEGKIQDLEMSNNQLKNKLKVLEMHVENDEELRSDDRAFYSSAERTEFQKMISSLSAENNSLKCKLLMQRGKEGIESLTSGVEDICPPFSSTSGFSQDDCFLPVEETPIVEGFVAEHSKTLTLSIDRKNDEEPDFVEEQAEGFQPEIEHEQVVSNIHPLNIHPIQESIVNEGFQPELSDIFVMEQPDGGVQQSRWPSNLTVGVSPSHHHSNMLQFDFNTPQQSSPRDDSHSSLDKKSLMSECHVENTEETSKSCHDLSPSSDEGKNETFTSAELERRIQAVHDDLEEKYIGKLRKQEVELNHDFATKQESLQREMEQSYAQRVQAVKYEWEHKFTKALQKVRKQMEKRHRNELRRWSLQGSSPSLTAGTSPRDARPDGVSEAQGDLGETVQQLHKENQELAEVRDVLLQQIEISNARGLHTKVQHELQSLLSNRDAANASLSPATSSATTTPTRMVASPTMGEETIENKKTENAGEVDADAHSEASESSSARERFLEELEDITQQSSQDLPLEWELTTTLMASAMIGAGDKETEEGGNVESNPPEHRSIWEVFDGRCVRQDCQELDTLRIQYEHQVSSLQRQLDAERSSNQEQTHHKREQYEELVCQLRAKLDQEQQASLDSALAHLSHVHTGEIKQLQAEHQNDICLELTAMKLSLEHVYASKSEMEAQESKQRHEQMLEALKKQHKEELDKISASQDKTDTTTTLMDQYNQLVKRISEDLEQVFSSEKPKTNHTGINGDGGHLLSENSSPASFTNQDIHELLQTQHEDISDLRAKLDAAHEDNRPQQHQEEEVNVAELEQQLANLHKQYQDQVEQMQTSIRVRDEEQQKEMAEHREQLERQQEDLKSHYEKRVQDMETSFENEISNMKEKYEAQISGLIHSKLRVSAGVNISEESIQERDGALPTAMSTPQQREYIHKTMALTAISDTDSDMSADMSRGAASSDDYHAKLKVLEAELIDRDSQLHELKTRLREQESISCDSEQELTDLNLKVRQLQQDASAALSRCSELQAFLDQKDLEIQLLKGENKDLNIVLEERSLKITQLEAEKAESEKLYKDLLEKESPRSKGSHSRDMPSGSSVDDSFASARDSIHNTPRSFVSDHLEFTSPRSDMGDGGNEFHYSHSNSNTHELSDSIPFANDSSDYPANNGNNNNNNSSSTVLEVAVEDLKRKVEELDNQLASAKQREEKLRLQIEESDHNHEEAIEMLKQELEHERKMEVETLQSEFRIQLEVELKRQAAQLYPEDGHDAPAVEESKINSSVHVQTKSDCYSANNNAIPLEESIVQQSSAEVETLRQGSPGMENDVVDPLLQTSGFDLQQVVQGNHNIQSSKAALTDDGEDDYGEDMVEGMGETSERSTENLSDDSKASTSPLGVPSPMHSSTPMSKRNQAEPLTDMEKEMEALREEYEAKLDKLKAERDAAEERYDRLMQGVQSGEYPELNQLMKDKYDEELELTKSLLQQDFDAQLKEEKKKFVEKHRKLMTDFMADREKEEEETNKKHTEELDQLRESLNREFEEKLSAYEQQLNDMQQTMPLNSKDDTCRDTSTPVRRPESVETGVQYEYEESEEETEAERAPTRQLRSFAEVVKSPSPASAQEMEFTIQQLTAQVERLTQQLAQQQQEGAEAKTPTRSPQHSPENDTLKEEDSALVAMLQSDLERISAERENVQRTNDRLLSLLSDSVKTYVGVEDTINRKLSMVVSGGTPRPPSSQPGVGDGSAGGAGSRPTSRPGSVETVPQLGREDSPAMDRRRATPDPDTSQDSHHLEDTSILSNATDEGLEISQRLAESIFVGPDLDAEGEEILTDARSRLTTAVGQLLELMEKSTVQLMEAKATQQELLDTLAARGQELESTASRTAELDNQLAAEIQAKDYLGLELHKAEGLIAGYSAERESLESQLQNLEEQREALIVDLDATRSRLEEFQRSQTEMDSARQELGRQQELLRDNAGQEMQAEEQSSRSPKEDTTPPALLSEVDSLNQEKRELAEQLQHQLDTSRRRLTELEALAEDAERRHEAQLEERTRQVEDLRLQLDNTERQLKASKSFVAEQMTEREQEREDHQREVDRLEELLQGKNKNANSQQRLQTEIADLNEQLQARITSQTNMHQRTLELQRALEDKELSAHDLKAWVAQLETELDQRGNVEEQLKQRITRLESRLTQQQSEEESQVDRDASQTEAASGASKDTRGGSPTILSPSRKPWTSQVSLEEEVLRSQKVEDELQHENTVLKEQVQQQMLQISGLRNQLDQLRHYGGEEADEDVTQLRVRLQTERDALERSEAQISEAQNKIESLEGLLKAKEEEAESVRLRVSKIMEIGDAQEENENLKSQLEELQSQVSHLSSVSSMPVLPPELLEEKNSEIEELRQRIQEQETQQQAQVRELQTRLKERDEEISDLQDNITSLRRGEPCLDVSLPFNEDADKVLNISMTGRTTRSARAVTPTSIQQELEDTMQEREGEIAALMQEVDDLKRQLANIEEELNVKKTEGDADKKMVSSLEETLKQKESKIYELTCEVEELRQQTQDKDQEITQVTEERDKAQEQLHEKEVRLDQMILQIDSLQEEISSLTTFQLELQKDFDTVQSMLDEKEKEIESLTKELTDNKTQQETLDTVGKVNDEVTTLRAEVASKSQQLQKEQKSAEDSQEALVKERKDMEEIRKERQAEREAEEKHIVSLQQSMEEKDSKIKDQEAKIDSLEKGMKEIQEKSQKEAASLLDALEKSAADYEKRIISIEEQLKTQGDNYAALKAAADHGKSIESKVALLTQEIQDKETALESLQNKLTHTAEQHDALVEDLKLQLVTKEKDQEKMLKDIKNEHEKVLQDLKNDHEKLVLDLKNYHEKGVENLKMEIASKEEDLQDVRRLLKETEEQLRLRQCALLDAQAEKEQLLQNSGQVDQLNQELEEKSRIIAELEGQLRFRQSCILDMEAEKERVLEERDDFEAELRQDLEEKERALQDIQDKYTRLKESLGEEVLHMEQEFQRSSQSRVLKTSPPEQESPSEENMSENETVDSLKKKLSQVQEELSAVKSKRSEVEERMAQTNLQLSEREEQLQQLQAEMQQQTEQSQSAALTLELQHKVSQMESLLKDAEIRAALEAEKLEESRTVVRKLEEKLKSEEIKEVQNDTTAGENTKDGDKINLTELKRLSQQQQIEMAKKEQELETVRQDLEKWIEVATGQNNLQQHLKDKESQIQSLKMDTDSLEEKLKVSQDTISSLQLQLSAQDEQLADAQQQLFILRTERGQMAGMAGQHDGDEILSPETKQSITHLKAQLRKAHAALEELKTGSEWTSDTEEELEKLKQELRQKEKELTILRSRFSGDELNTVKTLQDIREDHSRELAELQEQHDQDVRQLRKVQERKLEQALEELRQALEKEHKTELNTMKAQVLGIQNNSTIDGSSVSSLSSDDSLFPERLQTLLKRLNSLGEHLLSVSDLEYLQQHLLAESRPQGDTSAWSQERRSLMDQIDALKDLLQQADKVAKQDEDERSDWRSDLLQALVSVYEKERKVLQAEVNTADSLFPEVDIITQLEARIHDLEQVHQSGLDEMISADRQSLLDEVDSLHHQLLEARGHLQDARDSLEQRISQLEDAKSSAEWKLQRQIELLEYKLQQEAVVQEDLRKSMRLERSRVSELSQQSSRERARTLELQAELSETQIGLSKARDALEREQQRFSSVTDALEEERAKTNRLAELLESAKRRLSTVEEDVAHADARYHQRSNSEEEYVQELKSQLTRERQRSIQFSEAEEQAKSQVVQLTDTLDHLKAKVTSLRDEYEAKIEAIQREHAEKEMREQRNRLDAEAVTKLTQLLDEERESHQSALEQEKELTRQLRREADRVRLNHSQQLRQVESESTTQLDKLRQELSNTRAELSEKTRKAEAREVEEEASNRKKLRAVEKDKEELRLKVSQLEQELKYVQDRAQQLERELASHTRRSQQSQDSTDGRARQGHKEAVVTLLTASVIDEELKYRLGQCCSKLQTLACQLQDMTSQQQRHSRLRQEDFDNDDLAGVMAELDKLRAEIKEREQSASEEKIKNGPSDPDQVAELVKHNQQLAERVLRLRQDKEDLTNSLELLESRLKANVDQSKKNNVTSLPQYVSDVTSDEETVYDRTVWASERLSLQMALDSAEHEIQRLRGELQHFRKFMNADGQLVTVDHEKTTRLYGKFLRAESFRKALVYQKKYLLLLLGGYKDTEQETLAILASMGGFPSPGVGLSFHGRHSRAFTVFRSASRTVIAIFRMKYLVRKWKRATRVGSPVMTGQITHQHGYVPSSASFPSHQRYSGNDTVQRSHRHQRPPVTMTRSAAAASLHNHPNSNNSSSSTINSIDYIDSLSNGGVSTLTSNMYPAAARASPLNYTTPPTKDLSNRHTRSAPRGNREEARRRILQDEISSRHPQPSSARSHQVKNNDDDNFLHYLEKVKEQLSDKDYDNLSSPARRSGWR